MLPGDKVDGGVLEQSGEYKEQTHRHPDVDGLHIGHLQHQERQSHSHTVREQRQTDRQTDGDKVTVTQTDRQAETKS